MIGFIGLFIVMRVTAVFIVLFCTLCSVLHSNSGRMLFYFNMHFYVTEMTIKPLRL